MKKVRVTVIHEFEIPDDWMIISRDEDGQQCLLIDGKLYAPDMDWLRYEERDEDGTETWVEAREVMDKVIAQANETIEEIDHLMYDDEE